MKKMSKLGLLSLGLLLAGPAVAREIRTPLPTLVGFTHYPVHYHWEQDTKGDHCWNWDFTAGMVGYSRSTDKAYRKDRCTEEYVNLLFGASDFRFGQAYPDAQVALNQLLTNPFVDVATVKPRFEYHEHGTIFSMQLGAVVNWCDADYRFGLRGKLPFRDIQISDTCASSDLLGEQLGDLWQVRKEKNGTTENLVYAGRLDFLTRLSRLAGTTSSGLVFYGPEDAADTATNKTHRTKMADQIVSAAALGNGDPMVALLYGDKQSISGLTWGAKTAGMTELLATGATQAGRYYFKGFSGGAGTDYTGLALNTAAQSKLYVVPSLVDGANGEITNGAKAIRSAIETAISNLDSLDDFLGAQGLSFCNGRVKGFGDLDMELYLGRNWGCDGNLWTDVMVGLRLPTADGCNNCKRLLAQPLGNNEHWEVRAGLAGGYNIAEWVKFMLDASYSWALKHKEQVAAPFKGATIKNIGPCVAADIKWDYFLGHADLSFFANDCCGLNVGYELYHKRADNIKLCVSTALPLGYTEGSTATTYALDSAVLRNKTERTAHKARVSVFTTLGDCTLEGGWSHTFAGKHAPRDTDFYLNLGVAF